MRATAHDGPPCCPGSALPVLFGQFHRVSQPSSQATVNVIATVRRGLCALFLFALGWDATVIRADAGNADTIILIQHLDGKEIRRPLDTTELSVRGSQQDALVQGGDLAVGGFANEKGSELRTQFYR